MTPFEAATARRDELDAAYSTAGKRMRAYPRSAIGLTPDDVKASPAWQADKRAADAAFAALRAFNAGYVKAFAREIREARRARFGTV